jgi:hypothetical protein
MRQMELLGVVVQSVLVLFCGGEDYGGAIVGCGKRVLTYRASDDAAWSLSRAKQAAAAVAMSRRSETSRAFTVAGTGNAL